MVASRFKMAGGVACTTLCRRLQTLAARTPQRRAQGPLNLPGL